MILLKTLRWWLTVSQQYRHIAVANCRSRIKPWITSSGRTREVGGRCIAAKSSREKINPMSVRDPTDRVPAIAQQ
jgi:hypothetical protein